MPTEDYRAVESCADFEALGADANTGRSVPLATPCRHSGVRAAFTWHLRAMGLTTVCFLAIIALIMIFMEIVFSSTGSSVTVEAIFAPLSPNVSLVYVAEYLVVLGASCSFYFLVLGIIMPTYLEVLLGFGLTRKQNALGLLLAGAAIINTLAIAGALVGLLISQFDLPYSLNILRAFIGADLSFLVGWFIVTGYQFRSVIGSALTTAIGAAICLLGNTWAALIPEPTDGVRTLVFMKVTAAETDTEVIGFISALILIAILMPTIIALTRRIPLKV
jgi:hypothetical protein